MCLIIGKAYQVCDGETTVSAYLLSIAPGVYRFRSAQDELEFVVYQTDLDTGTFSLQPLPE